MTSFGNLNLNFPLILTISVYMSSLNFMFNSFEHEKRFLSLGPGLHESGCFH